MVCLQEAGELESRIRRTCCSRSSSSGGNGPPKKGVKIVPERAGATSPTELARLTDRYAVFTAKRETALLLRRGFEGLVGSMLPYPDVGLEPRTSSFIG